MSSRASSLAGWTHGFGDADVGDDEANAALVGDESSDDEAALKKTKKSARWRLDDAAASALAALISERVVERLRARCFVSATVGLEVVEARAKAGFAAASRILRGIACRAAWFAAALLAQHVLAWPGFAAVAPAAAFATGNLGSGAFVVSALTETAAFVASAASQTVSLAAAVATGAASGALGYAAAAESAAAEMQVLRAELAELRVAVAAAAAATREARAPEPPEEGAVRGEADDTGRRGSSRRGSTRGGRSDAPAAGPGAAGTAAELADLRARLARLRAARGAASVDAVGRGDHSAPAVDWNARARANAVWSPPQRWPDAARGGAARAPSEPGARVRAGSEAEEKMARARRALAAARAELRALRASGDWTLTRPGSREAHAPVAPPPTNYAAIAKARALWSPGAPGAAPATAGGGAARAAAGTCGASAPDASLPEAGALRRTPRARRHATGTSDEAAETARLEAEDREWRRRLRMDAGSEDPFGR